MSRSDTELAAQGSRVHNYTPISEVIDLRSFSNLWYWIALAVLWSTSSHWVLGVPYDMITRARRHGGQAQDDLEAIARINVNRILHIARVAGMWLIGFATFALTALGVTGFWYQIEFAQAVLLLLGPMAILGLLSIRSALKIERGESVGEALDRRLIRHRLSTQAIGVVSIFITAMWGMYQNLNIGVLGH